VSITPSIIVPTSGPSRLIVFVRSTDARIVYTTRTNSIWTTPVAIDANAFSNDPVSLISLANGGALVAFRAQNGVPYFSRYTPGGAPAWSQPAQVVGITTPSTPALASGIGAHDAEVALVDAGTGSVEYASLTGLTWSAPVSVGGNGLTHVAIASSP
jgi:hypothetical protein